MTLRQCMEEVTPAEYNVWMYRMQSELGKPSRTDYYIMKNTMELRKLYQATIRKVKPMALSDFILPVDYGDGKKPEKRKYTDAEKKAASDRAKAIHKMRHTKKE